MGINYGRMQRIVEKQIRNFGGGADNATLRRGTTDRPCSVVILDFSPAERQGSMLQYSDKKVLVSARGLTVPPDQEQDAIVLGGVVHRIVMPPKPLAPDGQNVLYWEVVARK